MILVRNVLLGIFFLLTVLVFGQKHQNNWYFGRNAAIQFSGTPTTASVATDNTMITIASACISDSLTGELLFYTNGQKVWNKNRIVMPNAFAVTTAPVGEVIIVPHPGNPLQYYIFTVEINRLLEYTLVDMSLDGGLGDVVSKNTAFGNNTAAVLTAVKHQFENSYWLITHSNQNPVTNSFRCYKITENGLITTPVISNAGISGKTFGDLVSNNKGNQLALTFYNDTNGIAQVFDFDKQCGTLSNAITLAKESTWDYAYGAAFSPDDSKLYISYSFKESQLIQYFGANFANWDLAATSYQNLNGIQIGPDDRLYISTHDGNIPSRNIDVLNSPNNIAALVGYQQNYLDLGIGKNGNFEFPNFITDTSIPKPTSGSHGLSITYTNTCIGDSTRFTLGGNANLPDSVKWHFIDPNSTDTVSYLVNPVHKFSQKGTYWVIVNYFRCGLELIMAQQVTIIDAADVSLGADTSFCYNDSIVLKSNATGMTYLWSTGETTETITVEKGGQYWVTVTSPTCNAIDSITITEQPPILIELGGNYTVCEHDTADLVKLDAGKGYQHYKWTPTNDTTQWIIVKQAGNYYVVVEDYRGCKGNDASRVARLCNFDFYLPNAFTPNGDGLNDIFNPTASDILNLEFKIFNTWGEKVFSTNNPQHGWDGTYKNKPSPQGIYLYTVSFKGYSNKQLKNYNFRGSVSLLR